MTSAQQGANIYEPIFETESNKSNGKQTLGRKVILGMCGSVLLAGAALLLVSQGSLIERPGVEVKTPASANLIKLDETTDVGDDLKDLSGDETYLNDPDNRNVIGELKDLPPAVKQVDLHSAYKITGDLTDLPRSITHVNFYDNVKITGDIKDLPRRATYINFHQSFKITGDLKDLP